MNCGDGTGGRSLRAGPDHRFIYTPVTMEMRRILRRLFIPVTIKDVAALAGVSPSTVSRICKDYPSISCQTKEKVGQAVTKLGYEPNFQASNLMTQSSRVVGIIPPPSEWEAYQNPLYLGVIRRINQYCNQKQYINTAIMGQNENGTPQAIKTMARAGLAGGFIVLYLREQDPVPDYLYKEGLLYVLIGKACRNVNQIIYVDSDNMLADREAAECLSDLDHVRIAHLSGDHSLLYNHNRKMGYMLALAKQGIPFDSQLRVEVPSMPEEQDQVLAAPFAGEDRSTTVLVSDDIPAMALEKAHIGLGLSISGDVSILSLNNSLLARLTLPPLASVDVNAYQLGIKAAAQMISHAENPELVVTKIIVPHHIMERESCAGTGGFCGD